MQDNGTIPFPEFLAKVQIPENSRWTPTDEQRQRCKEAWEDGTRAEGAKKKQKSMRRGASSKAVNADSLNVSIVSNA